MREGDGTHNKKRHHKIIAYHYKGVTPIEKNIIVVDEQGNEYEATYPKRAKGLVKNGRARFVDENKICLACPPDKILEEEKMSNNTNNQSEQKVNGITEQQIFEQITLLQTQLTQNAQTSLHRLSDALDFIGEDNENELPYEQITEICNVFKTREITLLKLLEMYEKMYADIQIAKKMELIKNVRLSTLQDMKEFYSEEELVERADSVLSDVSLLCHDIYLTKN